MIKQTRKPIQLTKSMLINILRDIEAYFRTLLQYAETKGLKLTEFEQTLRRKGLRSQGVFITLNK